MISRNQLQELIGDYEHALRLVNEAATILEDQSMFAVEVTGHFGPASSKHLITTTNNLCSDLTRALDTLTAALTTA
jgi:hypothetical protein